MAKSRRRLKPDERRQELLEAALEVFCRADSSDCRIEDITTAAGTAKGNFYRYFGSFDDLVVAVRDHLLDRYRAEIAARMAARSTIDWWQVLDEEVDAFVRFQSELAGLHDAVFHGPAARASPIARKRAADTIIARLLRAGIRAGAFDPVDVEPTAALIFHVLHAAAGRIVAGADPRRTARAARRMIRRTLGDPT